MKKTRGLLFITLVLSIALVALSGCGKDDGAESSFPEKNMEFIVTVPPGGGFDTYSRAMVPFLEKHLPNDISIVVKNITGGDHAIGINRILNAKPDGYIMGMFSIPGLALNESLGRADFRLKEITWLGNITSVPAILFVSADSSYESIEDIVAEGKKRTLKVPSMLPSSPLGSTNVILANELGIEVDIISSEAMGDSITAMLRNEGDYCLTPVLDVVKGHIETNQLRPLAIIGEERCDALPDVPTIAELGYPAELANFAITRYFVGATPGIPEEIASILQDSFKQAINDPEFEKALAKLGDKPDYIGPDECQKMVLDSLSLYDEKIDILSKHIK